MIAFSAWLNVPRVTIHLDEDHFSFLFIRERSSNNLFFPCILLWSQDHLCNDQCFPILVPGQVFCARCLPGMEIKNFCFRYSSKRSIEVLHDSMTHQLWTAMHKH